MRRLLLLTSLLVLRFPAPAHADVLRGSALYAALDRPDLAERYEQNVLLRRIGIGTGGGLVAAGLFAALYDQATAAGAAIGWELGCSAVYPVLQQECAASHHDSTWTYLGLGAAGAGAVLVLVSALADPDPLDAVDRARLLEEHRCAGEAGTRPRLLPLAAPGAVGLSLSMRL